MAGLGMRIDFASVITQRVKLLLSQLDDSNGEATAAEVFQVTTRSPRARGRRTPSFCTRFICTVKLVSF